MTKQVSVIHVRVQPEFAEAVNAWLDRLTESTDLSQPSVVMAALERYAADLGLGSMPTWSIKPSKRYQPRKRVAPGRQRKKVTASA